ncbi:Gfo/Idh/MocA family oxidoreductase [bacterium]|nr:Gfo/Idh/MocA family oxidoreductase [bacterium]
MGETTKIQNQGQLRVAIAGCHRMLTRTPGSHNFATAFHAVPETQVVAIFDRGADTREQFVDCWHDVWGNIPTYDDYPRMLEEIKPDLVCISTRQTLHAEQIELAVKAGVRGILCDKPLATSMTETDRIIAACQNVPLLFALDRRWMARYQHLRKIIADGAIGAVTNIVAYGLPNLINHGCHWYDTILALAGDVKPVWVSGLVDDVSVEPEGSYRRIDPAGRGQVGLANEVVFYVTSAGSLSFEITGEKGRLFLLEDARESFIWLESSDDELNMLLIELPEETEQWPAGKTMVRDLVQAVQTGSRTSCDVEHARRATAIGFAIHVSSSHGGMKVALPLIERSLRIESFPWGNE